MKAPQDIILKPVITEKEYLEYKGMLPLSINVVKVACKAILGLYTAEKMEPLVKARIRSEQKVGELLSESDYSDIISFDIAGSVFLITCGKIININV